MWDQENIQAKMGPVSDPKEPYREALRLDRMNRSLREIAAHLGVPLRQAENMLRVARALGEEGLRAKVRRPRKNN